MKNSLTGTGRKVLRKEVEKQNLQKTDKIIDYKDYKIVLTQKEVFGFANWDKDYKNIYIWLNYWIQLNLKEKEMIVKHEIREREYALKHNVSPEEAHEKIEKYDDIKIRKNLEKKFHFEV